jgi:N-acetylglucosamine PTS system EIICBA or EIICB component
VLTGLAVVIMHAAGIHLAFTFSAGLFDYILNFSRATRPLWLLPIGAGYFALYYFVFREVITRFNLATPGREPAPQDLSTTVPLEVKHDRAAAFVAALGGVPNLTLVDACTTRLRLSVGDATLVDAAALARLGAHAVVRLSANALQVVVGANADQIAGEIRRHMRQIGAQHSQQADEAPTRSILVEDAVSEVQIEPRALLAALGGKDNVDSVEIAPDRLLVRVIRPELVEGRGIEELAVRAAAASSSGLWHILVGPAAPAVAESLRCELR